MDIPVASTSRSSTSSNPESLGDDTHRGGENRMTSRGLITSLVSMILITSCARVNPDDPPDADGDADADADADIDGDADVDGDGDADGDYDPLLDVIIYAHSRDTLFAFSPFQNLVVSEIVMTMPDATPAPAMVDLAVNADGEIYTSGYDTLFVIAPDSGVATPVGEFRTEEGLLLGEDLDTHLFALTFVPESLYPDAEASEVLIGAANEGNCFEVDPHTAVSRSIGTYPAPWRSSGDLVSVEGLDTTFATLREIDSEATDPDYLAKVTFLPGGDIELTEPGAIRNSERVFLQIFGLGYWGRGLYGFSNTGELIEIDRRTAVGELATEDTGAEEFWGAGVTTQVPVVW